MTPHDTYSTYDAKARFSEVLRKVREGRTITITYHGRPVAEIHPIESEAGTEARLSALRDRGLLRTADERQGRIEPLTSRPGALGRFLADRE